MRFGWLDDGGVALICTRHEWRRLRGLIVLAAEAEFDVTNIGALVQLAASEPDCDFRDADLAYTPGGLGGPVVFGPPIPASREAIINQRPAPADR